MSSKYNFKNSVGYLIWHGCAYLAWFLDGLAISTSNPKKNGFFY